MGAISANSFVQRAGIVALSKEGDEEVARMRAEYDKRRKLMVELMRGVGFNIPVMPQGAFYVFAEVSKFTDDSYKFAFELLEKAGVGVAPGVDFGQRVAGPDPAATRPSPSTTWSRAQRRT